MHLEFVVAGVPISNQSTGTPALIAWRAAVEAGAQCVWSNPPLAGNLKVVIINFHTTERPSLDLDNMCKPILDVMQEIVYDDDRQVTQVEVAHVPINAPFVFVGVSRLIVAAIQIGNEFVYVRVDKPAEPLPLPR